MVRRIRSKIAGVALMLVVTLATWGNLLIPSVAYAQNTTVADVPRIGEWVVKTLKDIGESALMQSLAVVLINTATYVADRAAYDAAVFIASGGNANDPLFENRNVGEYFADFGADIAGEAIGLIDEEGLLGGFSLCAPQADADVYLSFKLGVTSLYDRPEPRCEFNDIQENWEGFLADIATLTTDPIARNQAALEQLSQVFDFRQNGLSSGIILYTDILAKAQKEQFYETQKLLLNGGFKDQTDFLTEKVDTPADLLKRDFTRKIEGPDDTRKQITFATLGDKDLLLQLAAHAGQVFTNTLLSEFTERMYSGLFSDLDRAGSDPFDEGALATYSLEDARNSFRSFLAAAPLEVTNYSVLGEFGACPTIGRGLYNCVADSSLISAVARAESGAPLTVREALEEGLLNENWPLIPSSDTARNQDQYCYTYGYCHSNLVKLRKARIISIGWEMAAEAEANTESDPATLGRVVSGFDDPASPYYRMIDPEWVLKYPDTQCRAQVYGQLLETSASDQRKEECVDMPSCIAEDGNGTCTGGYGYCVREENVWRFRGEECPGYYASCTEFEDPDGNDFAFLTNTVDAGPCDESNAGCMWYATQKADADGDGAFDWIETADTASDAYQNRIYFTSAIEECDDEDAGCRELVRRGDDLTLNMIVNPGFEDDLDADGMPDGWFKGWFGSFTGFAPEYSTDSSLSLNGTSALSPGNASGFGAVYQTGIVLNQSTTYTLSMSAVQSDTVNPDYLDAFFVLNADEDGDGDLENIDPTGVEVSGECEITATTIGSSTFYTYAIEERMPGENADGTVDGSYAQYSCTFAVPSLRNTSADVIGTLYFTATSVYVDNVQLEQSAEASDWHEGYSEDTLDLAYVKVPPSYLGCTGSDSDPEECVNYAAICSEEDVGCSSYTPTNGDPTVNGVANALDECPATCVGYDAFKQEPTLYEPEGDFPVYFIPETAQECSDSEVGCDEFTNLATEEIEYFTYLRACVTEDQAAANISSDGAATFYTWEGSDLEGYQLVTWTLLESDLGSRAFTYESGEVDAEPAAAPCTSWVATESGIECDDDGDGDSSVDGDPVNVDSGCDEHSDIFVNPDCREFYDASGGIHYREWSKTVTVNNACVSYRKTEIAGSDAATQALNCSESGGYYSAEAGTCRYYGYNEESEGCSADAAGCREYTGGRSRNSRVAFTDLFEDGTLANWDAASAATVTLSNESIATGGHSLASVGEEVWTFLYADGECTDESGCESGSDTLGASCTVAFGETSCGTLDGEMFDQKTYTLSFWAKGSGAIEVGFDLEADVADPTIDLSLETIDLEEGWNEYQLGPIDAAEYEGFGDDTVLVFTPSAGVTFYLDNVVLRAGEDNITVIKDSWETPAECDETPEGTSSPQYYLGCAEYTDQEGEEVTLKSFSSLCNEDQVGCEAFYMTQESDATNAQVYGAVCNNDIDGDGVNTVATSRTDCYMEVDASASAFDADSQYLCTIGIGEESCTFDLGVYIDPGSLPEHLTYVSSTAVVPADRDIFLVVNDDVECSSDVAGCTELGLPTFNQAHTGVDGFTSTYLINDPDTYSDTLCAYNELFCEEYVTGQNERYYFKNPQDQTCEYREDVTVDGVVYDGWFKTGTDDFCDEDYVIGGDFAGIWRNGDAQYDNWVGVCESRYDSCSEFQDLTDVAEDELYGSVDGASYYYLNNNQLDESSLPESRQCNGQVGQKDGCGLFNDTSDPNKAYNMSASYIASVHADDFFGDAPNSLVDPVSCDDSVIELSDGSTVDLCDMRCGYTNVELTGDASETGYSFGGSCYVNSDCQPVRGETGLMVEGTCMSARSNGGDRLENDANTILRVDRDRQCSEWLACSDTMTTWDERTNSFKTVCGDVELCTEYSSTGNASFCSDWKMDEPAVVLTEDVYVARDVSWYGDDYSGYAIPDVFPVQTLSQVNVAPPEGYCDLTRYDLDITTSDGTAVSRDYADYHGEACTDDSDCGGYSGACVQEEEADYRLAYVAGSCEGYDYNEECTVGYCAGTGEACTSSDTCDAGDSCVVGVCYDVSTTTCQTNADCASVSDTAVCSGAVCIDPLGDHTVENALSANSCAAVYGTSTAQLYESTSTKVGSCLREQCVLTPDGRTFNESMSEDMVCRGYPEIDSPFPNDIVDEWVNPADENDASVDEDDEGFVGAVPYSKRTGFDMAKTCSPEEPCECSYKKVTFGQSMTTRYYALDSRFPDGDGNRIGVCSGGDYEGAYCTNDPDLPNEDGYVSVSECESDGGGTCMFATREDLVVGLHGYCLERDTGINILGDREQEACLTWLPVDQLVGSTDLYAKYTEAGYFEETEYCSEVALFGDVYATSASADGGWAFPDAEMLCGEANDIDVADDPYCTGSIDCLPGFFAVVGPRWESGDATDTYSYTCNSTGSGFDNDCPYVCVPIGAVDSSGESCDADPQNGGAPHVSGYTSEPTDTDSAKIYAFTNAESFTNYANAVQDCAVRGRRISDGASEVSITDPAIYHYSESRASEFTRYGNQAENIVDLFVGCAETVVVTNENYEGAPYTDRILNPERADGPFALSANASYARSSLFEYSAGSLPEYFGRTITTTGLNRPPVVTACYDSNSGSGYNDITYSAPELNLTCDGTTEDESNGATFEDPEARAFTDFSFRVWRNTDNDSASTALGGHINLIDVSATAIAGPSAGSTDGGDGWTYMISQIFAQGLGGQRYEDGVYSTSAGVSVSKASVTSGGFTTIDPDDESRYGFDDRREGVPPSVYAVNTSACNGDQCEEDQDHALTLGDQNSGNITAAHFYRAYLKFYAAAYKEQLPIRRVIVEWGDEEGTTDQVGSMDERNFYKNRRGLQDGEQDSICEKADLGETYEWGMTEESCDPYYFSYSHIYTCENPAALPACSLDDDGNLAVSPCSFDGDSCSYQPRVHVRDNWGWCTGTCNDSLSNPDRTDGCFDADEVGLTSSVYQFDECAVSDINADDFPGMDPWVYYEGYITVNQLD